MPQSFLTDSGRHLVVKTAATARLGAGGQGQVYRAQLGSDILAIKLLRDVEAGRLRALQRLMPSCGEFATLPLHLIYSDQSGRPGPLLGYAMRYLGSGHSVSAVRLFNFEEIENLQRYSWADAVRAALRLAQTVAQLHRYGVVIGDLNPENVVFEHHNHATESLDWRAVLLDADSFQIQSATGERYFCPVNRPLYTAPELIGAELRSCWREPSSDAFALAVLIYQLLLHDHPFDNAINHAEPDLSVTSKIRRGLYPHAALPAAAVVASPYRPAPAEISTAIDQAFRRSFSGLPGLRPTAMEWVVLLQELKQQVVRCQRSPQHHHPAGQPCLWCAAERRIGQPICRFPTASSEPSRAAAAVLKPDPNPNSEPGLEELQHVQGRLQRLLLQRAQLAEALLQLQPQLRQLVDRHGHADQWVSAAALQSPMRSLRQRISRWLGHRHKLSQRQALEEQLLRFAAASANELSACTDRLEHQRRSLLQGLAEQSLAPLMASPFFGSLGVDQTALLQTARERHRQQWRLNQLAAENLRHWQISGFGESRLQLLEAHGVHTGMQLAQQLDRITAIPGLGKGLQRRLEEHLRTVIEQLEASYQAPPVEALIDELLDPNDLAMLDQLEACSVMLLGELTSLQQRYQQLLAMLQTAQLERDQQLQAYGALF